jgi:hypothetical protein
MFNNIPEMFAYIEKLRKTLDKIISSRKEQLNNFCEYCHKKEIEVEWRPTDFCNEYIEDGIMKYKVDIKFFCQNCYDLLVEKEKIVPGEFTIFYKEKKEEI